MDRVIELIKMMDDRGSSDNLHIFEYFTGSYLASIYELISTMILKTNNLRIDKWEVKTQQHITNKYCRKLLHVHHVNEDLDVQTSQLAIINSVVGLLESYKSYLLKRNDELNFEKSVLRVEKYLQSVVENISKLEKTVYTGLREIQETIYFNNMLNTLAISTVSYQIAKLGRLIESFRIRGFGVGVGVGLLAFEGKFLPYK